MIPFIIFCQGWKAMPTLPGVSEEEQKQMLDWANVLTAPSLGIKIPEETSATAS